MESPNKRQRQYHERYICQDIGDRFAHEEIVDIDVTIQWLRLVPESGDGGTLEDCH